jgi:hypothetical protein
MTPYLERLVVDCTCGLFEAYGLLLKHTAHSGVAVQAQSRQQESSVTACLVKLRPEGPAAASLPHGALLVVASFALIARCRPMNGRGRTLSPLSAGDWIYVRDWARELTNQLAARITNRLTTIGDHFSPCPPTVLTAVAAERQLVAAGGGDACFTSPERHEVHVLAELPTRAPADAHGRTSAPGPREGSVTLFDEDDDA